MNEHTQRQPPGKIVQVAILPRYKEDFAQILVLTENGDLYRTSVDRTPLAETTWWRIPFEKLRDPGEPCL